MRRKTQKDLIMVSSPTIERGSTPLIQEPMLSTKCSERTLHSIDEFADKLGKKLGQHYGLNDIRELL